MKKTNQHERLDYLEFPATDLQRTRTFFEETFGWEFTLYGPDYMDSASGGVMVGFFRSNLVAQTETGSVLVTFFSHQLESTAAKIEAAGGKIVKPVFEFPGGRRFQFIDPSGNEWAVWSDQKSLS